MHASTIISFFTLSALARAFTLPAGATEGLYKVSKRSDGTEAHEVISTSMRTRRSPNPAPQFANPPDTEDDNGQLIYCGCGVNLDQSDTDSAVSIVEGQLDANGGAIPIGNAYYSIQGNVVAFACAQSYGGQNCFGWAVCTPGSKMAGNLAVVTSDCGAYVAGTMGYVASSSCSGGTFPDESYYRRDYGYMIYSDGLTFCEPSVAEASSQSSC